jgi:C-terminal processing protease CtpA/Prc
MKKMRFIWVLLFAVMIGCSDSSPTSSDDPDSGNENNEEASAQKEFVWDAMNYWYYWQGDVTELGDDYFEDDTDFNNYLKDFSDAEALFESLRHPDDDFSFFIDDYEEYQNEQDGIYAALGFNYGFFYRYNSSQPELVGYVRYVIPDSPAAEAGLKRLDVFTKVNGNEITINNFQNLLTDNSAQDLTLAEIKTSEGKIDEFVDGETVTVESREVIEDPIYTSEVVDTSNVKIGYLMYNSFQTNSHQDLNDVFADFKNQGINELVLDLRYNGGGSVLTSQLLGSLISGLGSSKRYATLAYNEKRSQRSRDLYFLDEVPVENADGDFEDSGPVNSVELSQLYVLTSSGTASASEAVINSLRPYMDVTVIGLKTIGKDEGSLTLYDAPAPYLDDDEANPDHKKAIQPIVTKIINSQEEDYPDGFKPDGYVNGECEKDADGRDIMDNCMSELTFNNLLKKPSIGDPKESLFARALDLIIGQSSKQKRTTETRFPALREIEMKNGVQDLRPNGNGMYIEPFMIPTNEN